MELHKWQGAAWQLLQLKLCLWGSLICPIPVILFNFFWAFHWEPPCSSESLERRCASLLGEIQDPLLPKMWLFMVMVEHLWQKPYYVLWVIFRCMFLSLQRQDLRGSWQDLSSPQTSWKKQNILLPDASWEGSCQEQEELKEFSNFEVFCPWNQPWSKKS